MKQIALDTNAYRALEEGQTMVRDLVQHAELVALPVTVLGELYYGFEYGSKRQENVMKLDRFMTGSRVGLLDITAETARIFGEIAAELARIGKPTQQNDIWIAALCKQYRYVLVTADKAFQNIIGLD